MFKYLVLLISFSVIASERGSLTVITGPMYSGKTQKIIECIMQMEHTHKVAVFSHIYDVRRVNFLSSRALPNTYITAMKVSDSTDIVERHLEGAGDVIAIDEAQFFDDALTWHVKFLLDKGCNVIISGLDMDFKAKPFSSSMGNLCLMADIVYKLKATCNVCMSHDATLTQRLVDGNPAKASDEIICIDTGKNDKVTYEPRCKHCYIAPN